MNPFTPVIPPDFSLDRMKSLLPSAEIRILESWHFDDREKSLDSASSYPSRPLVRPFVAPPTASSEKPVPTTDDAVLKQWLFGRSLNGTSFSDRARDEDAVDPANTSFGGSAGPSTPLGSPIIPRRDF